MVGLDMAAAAETLAEKPPPHTRKHLHRSKQGEAAFRVSRALGRELKIDTSLKMVGNGMCVEGTGRSRRGSTHTCVAVCSTHVCTEA